MIAHHCKKVIGIDLSSNLLHILQQKTEPKPNIDLIHANLISIPLKKDCLDAVLFIASLHNIPKRINRKASLKELYRVLKSNGTVLLSVWNKNLKNINNIYDNIKVLNIDKKHLEFGDVFIYWNQDGFHIPRYYHLYERKEILEELEDIGFSIEEINKVKISAKVNPDNLFILAKK